MPMAALDVHAPALAQAIAGTGVSAHAERAAAPADATAPKPERPVPPPTAQAAAVAHANRVRDELAPTLEFRPDGESHRVVVHRVDREDRRVIRQQPNEEMLAEASAIERLQGALLEDRV